MSDIQRLIDSTFPFVKDLLTQYGEFFPVASAVTLNDSIAQVGTYDGNDKPQSDKLIADLKRGFKAKQADYKCVAIFYDVSVSDPATKLKTDAVAVFVETQSERTGYIIFYPYVLTTVKKLKLSDGAWKELNDKEIFIK